MLKRKLASSKITAAFLAACWAFSPLAAAAAEPGGEKKEFSLPEIVVTATRTEQTVKGTPSTVQVITSEQIEQRQSQTLADVLQEATGIVMFNDFQSRPQLSIRGSESRHVLIMVDGRRLSGELSYNSANAYDISRIRMENVERIEIIRGPAGALYGSDAMGGVINIITKKPKQSEGRLSYEYAVWDGGDKANQNMQFYYQGVNDAGNFNWSLSAGQHKPQPFVLADSSGKRYTANYYGKEQPLALSGEWSFDNGNHLRVDYSTLREKTNMGTLFSMSAMMPAQEQVIRNDNTRTDWSVEYGGRYAAQDWQIRAYQSKYDKDYSSYNNGSATPYRFDLVERTISALEGRNSWQAGDNQRITAGWEWRKDDSEGTRIKKPGSAGKPVYYPGVVTPGTMDDAAIEYRALYLQDEYQAGEKLLIIPSLRYDWSDKFSSKATPRLGLTYKAQDDLRVKAVIGKGYKTPTVNELYHSWEMFGYRMGTPGQFFQGNPDIRPESSTDYELSVEKDWDKTTARMSVFRNNVNDLIDSYWTGKYINPANGTVYDTAPGGSYDQLMSYRNVDKATIQGFEAELSQQLTESVKLRAGYVYLDAKDDDTDSRLTQRARHQLTFGVRYLPPQSTWNMSLDVVTLKDFLTNEGSALSGNLVNQSYSVVNVMAQNNVNKNTMLYLGVDNLTDHIDYNHGNVGRVYRTGIQYKF